MKTRTVQVKQAAKPQMCMIAVNKEISVPLEIQLMALVKGALMVSRQ